MEDGISGEEGVMEIASDLVDKEKDETLLKAVSTSFFGGVEALLVEAEALLEEVVAGLLEVVAGECSSSMMGGAAWLPMTSFQIHFWSSVR